MTSVWNRFTSQIGTWFCDEKRDGDVGFNQLRPSCSLSTLNHKNIRVVRSSKSSENLHRIQQHHAVFTAKCKQSEVDSQLRYNYIAAAAAASPSTSSQCSSGVNTTSGYSTNDGGVNGGHMTRKKSIGADFILNFRITKLKKTFSAVVSSATGTSKSPDQGISTFTPTSTSVATTGRHCSNSKSSNYRKRSESITKDSSVDFVFIDSAAQPLDNSTRLSRVPSQLFHKMPMSMSWHNNLNAIHVARQCHGAPPPAAYPSLLNNWYFGAGITAPPPREYVDTSLKINPHTEKPDATTVLRRFATGIFNGSINNSNGNDVNYNPSADDRMPLNQKPKRSSSVGIVRINTNTVKRSFHGIKSENQWLRPQRLLMMSRQGVADGSGLSSDDCALFEGVGDGRLNNIDDALVYNNQRAIDANFLALVQKDQPVLKSDRIFRRLEKLGEGSYATVYKSENKLDGSIVALKEIKLQPQEGLPFTAIREISLLRDLKHANIVFLYQIVHQPHSLILVFEYVKTDLSHYMERHRCAGISLEPFQIKLLLFQLLRGLAFCHDRKILHRDLKPQNLLVSEDGELKLADFGLARAMSVPCRTFSHDVVTLWYRPPDVLLGSTQYSMSLDMWGVGCIFAEMCSGVALFPGVNDAADQLERIFAIRGLPDVVAWPAVVELPNYASTMHRLQYTYRRLEWRSVDAQLARLLLMDNGAMLLESFLQMNPADRISAHDAMTHEYFSALPSVVHNLQPMQSVINAISDYKRQ